MIGGQGCAAHKPKGIGTIDSGSTFFLFFPNLTLLLSLVPFFRFVGVRGGSWELKQNGRKRVLLKCEWLGTIVDSQSVDSE